MYSSVVPFHLMSAAPNGAIEAVRASFGRGPGLTQNRLTCLVHLEDHLGSRLKVQGIANVLGDGDLAFAGDRGFHWVAPRYYRSFYCNTKLERGGKTKAAPDESAASRFGLGTV